MNVVMVHNYYGSSAPSGENEVFEAECQLLQEKGEEVIKFTRHSDDIRKRGVIGTIEGGLSTPWNQFSLLRLKKMLRSKMPTILHVHNSFPLLSPSIFYSCKGTNISPVLTLHNYRTFCAAGIPMRGGKSCTECIEKRSVWPALKHGCYRNSRIATLPIAVMVELHRRLKTWERRVDAFIALTSFQREALSNGGLPRHLVHVKPHFYPNAPEPLALSDRELKVVFMGRLGIEKGVHVLLKAWKRWGNAAPLIEMIGDGPERPALEDMVRTFGLADKVKIIGQLPFAEAQARLARSRLLVVPSVWFEGFPMVIREALALGVPVAASNLGSMPCLVEEALTGTLFEPGDPEDLLRKVAAAWAEQGRLAVWGKAARREFEQKYTADANFAILMGIYEKAIARRKQRIARIYSH
ncbi:MAG: glycosyltransferase family 4 protein [Syntrophaceae bacterium]|nr:glycosyltransferase family 4 protein [Syntrophaceae bacterium]